MIAGHLQEKNGYFYIVLSYKDENGKRKTPWFATNLPVKGNKRRAEQMLLEKRNSFIPPTSLILTNHRTTTEPNELLFSDFLKNWLQVTKSTVRLTTYSSYASMVNSIIAPYFEAKKTPLSKLTLQDIQTFYILMM